MQLHEAAAVVLLLILLLDAKEEEDTNSLSLDDTESSLSLKSESTTALTCQRREAVFREGNTRGCAAHSGRSYTA